MNSDDVKDLMREAFTKAFQDQLGQLYKIYTSNFTTVPNQGDYTKKGIENAVAAYMLALEAVNSWEGPDAG